MTDGLTQLVITGDFFQLPPVTKNGKEPFFAFECEAWQRCVEHTVMLTHVYRQKDDRQSHYLRTPILANIPSRLHQAAQRAAPRHDLTVRTTDLHRALARAGATPERAAPDGALPATRAGRVRQQRAPRAPSGARARVRRARLGEPPAHPRADGCARAARPEAGRAGHARQERRRALG